MVEPDAVFEVPDGVLAHGVAAVTGVQLDGVALSVGHEGVVVVGGEQGQLGARGPAWLWAR